MIISNAERPGPSVQSSPPAEPLSNSESAAPAAMDDLIVDAARVVEKLVPYSPELSREIASILQKLFCMLKHQDHPAPSDSEPRPAKPPLGLPLASPTEQASMSRPMQSDEDYAAYEAECERALQFGRRRPAISIIGDGWVG